MLKKENALTLSLSPFQITGIIDMINGRAKHKERIVFRNGDKLIITTRRIQTRRGSFSLADVLDHGIVVNQPNRILPVSLLVIGILLFIFSNAIRVLLLPETYDGSSGMLDNATHINIELVAQSLGILLIITGLSLLIIFRTKYNVILRTIRGFAKIYSHRNKGNAVNVEMSLHEAILYMPRELFKKAQSRVNGNLRNFKDKKVPHR